MDKKNYKNTIKECKITAIKAMDDYVIGESKTPLEIAYKKVIQSNLQQNWWIILWLYIFAYIMTWLEIFDINSL